MKQETYNKLKLVWKAYEYAMYILFFTIGLIALTFGAVYLGRKACEPNIQEVNKHEKNPYRAIENSNSTGYMLFNSTANYNDESFSESLYEFQQKYYPSVIYYLDVKGVSIVYDGYTYNRVYCHMDYHTGDDLEGWYIDSLAFLDVNDSSIWNTMLSVTSFVDTPSDYHFSYYVNNGGTKPIYIESLNTSDADLSKLIDLLKVCFVDTLDFTFTSDYNFATLTSEVVTSERLIIPFNNQFNGDPSDEFIEFYLKADFVSNNVLYKGILFVLNKPIYVYKDGLQTVNFVGSLSQLMVKQVYYMKSLPAHMPYENYPLEFSLSSDCDLVANKHIIRYETYNDVQTDRQVPVYDYKQFDWVNQTYRLVYFSEISYNSTYYPVFYPTDNTMWSNRLYLGLTLYQVLNNGYYDYNYSTNTYVLGGSNDLSQAFTLLAGAFGGLTSLMYIQVLPGISLGLLFFVPLIVTIIIVVLRLVKK